MSHITTQPTILSIEDDRDMQDLYAQILLDHCRVLTAFTVEEGLRRFSEHPEIVIIVMDGVVPCRGITTVGLTKEIRKRGFAGPMIASSNHLELRSALMDAGCDHQSVKADVPNLVMRLLRIA